MPPPLWHIKIILPRTVYYRDGREMEHPTHILAYYSLAGPRTDFPPSIIPLDSITQ
ncbi:putative leucine-rich repeat domain superfamily [Helianthus annuus]|nr:putative leucine-rich repeat domain superfamily [Helianthus annuus]KAJ0639511.1 putative leucine-rich repeat domain superfamily [Helianthus annuus]